MRSLGGESLCMYGTVPVSMRKCPPLGPPAVVTVLSLSYLVTMVYALRAHTGILSPCFLLLSSWCWRHKRDPVGYWEASILLSKEKCPTSSFLRWVGRKQKLCQRPIASINTLKWLLSQLAWSLSMRLRFWFGLFNHTLCVDAGYPYLI